MEVSSACGTKRASDLREMYDADFGDLRFVLMVVAAFLMGIVGSLTQLNAVLPS